MYFEKHTTMGQRKVFNYPYKETKKKGIYLLKNDSINYSERSLVLNILNKKNENIFLLEKFLKLEFNWNDNNANPIDPELIEKCKVYINNLFYQPNIFPTARDSIQFEYYKEDGSYLEFEIFIKRINCILVDEKKKISEKKNITFSEMEDIVESFNA